MLEEVRSFKNLGTPRIYWELLGQMDRAGQQWNADDIRGYLYNRIIDGKSVFDGCVPFLKVCGILSTDTDGYFMIEPSIQPSLINEQYLKNKTLERIFIQLTEDEIFHKIFNSINISYDIVYNYVQVDNAAFTFKYANFKQLLLDFDFLLIHPDDKIKKYIINTKYKKLFDKTILPEIKRTKMGIDELDKKLSNQRQYGEEAEEFVVDFEKNRLRETLNHKKVAKISDYDVAAGYDVVSFNDGDSEGHDRFIEVKSYVGDFNFFWSENEIRVSRIKTNQYYLYLVNRDEMNNDEYVPEIIQNPYENVYLAEDHWDLRPKKFYVSLKSN